MDFSFGLSSGMRLKCLNTCINAHTIPFTNSARSIWLLGESWGNERRKLEREITREMKNVTNAEVGLATLEVKDHAMGDHAMGLRVYTLLMVLRTVNKDCEGTRVLRVGTVKSKCMRQLGVLWILGGVLPRTEAR